MEFMKCKYCGNRYHWHHAFSKFGYDDGDGKIQTPEIVRILANAGYTVKYSRWLAHNVIITSIRNEGIELMPLDDTEFRIGYDDPATYLPEDILNLLNRKIPPLRIFR